MLLIDSVIVRRESYVQRLGIPVLESCLRLVRRSLCAEGHSGRCPFMIESRGEWRVKSGENTVAYTGMSGNMLEMVSI